MVHLWPLLIRQKQNSHESTQKQKCSDITKPDIYFGVSAIYLFAALNFKITIQSYTVFKFTIFIIIYKTILRLRIRNKCIKEITYTNLSPIEM